MARPARKSSRAAGLFVLLGIVTILGGAFGAGVYAGRISATRPTSAVTAAADREPGRRGTDARTSRFADPAPRLTFYHELTAPLTAPPPPPKPAKTSPPPLMTSSAPRGNADIPPAREPATPGWSTSAMPPASAAAPATTSPRDGATTASSSAVSLPAGPATPATSSSSLSSRFTVQVGAYKARGPADALRATLAAAGHEARVVETDAANSVRFRVQVGDFASRDAAREAAARLTGPTFVTTR